MIPILQVMIVDDDKIASMEGSRIIKESGVTNCVKTALNGGHALLFLNQIYTDLKERKLLILLDTKMPIMNGIEFLRHYDRCEYTYKENIRIVMLVDENTSKHDITEARDLGVKDFLQKPFTAASLNKLFGTNTSSVLEKVA